MQTKQLQSSISKAESDLTVNMESVTDALLNHDLVENKLIKEEKDKEQQQLIPESCLSLEPSSLSDVERYGKLSSFLQICDS